MNGSSQLFLLFLTFLILKLCNVITWSWWWVTAPLWGGFALIAAFSAVAFPIAYLIDKAREKKS